MRSDARANRQALVEAATTLFAAQGVDVALTAIAERAGTGIATLYRNFPTRDDLVQAVIVDVVQQVQAIQQRHLNDAGTEHGWRNFVHELSALRPGVLMTTVLAPVIADGVPAYLAPLQDETLATQDSVLDRAKAARLVRDDVTPMLFRLGLAAATRPLTPQPWLDPDDYEPWLVDLYIRGLRPDPT